MMPAQNDHIASTLIPQSNYRRYHDKPLTKMDTAIPPIGKTHPEKHTLLSRIQGVIETVNHTVMGTHSKNTPLIQTISRQLFQPTSSTTPATLDDLWAFIELTVLNSIKVHYLMHHIDALLQTFHQRLTFLTNKYKRHLPQHISMVEGDDLMSIAQLEFIETFKAWNMLNHSDIWPLAYTRVNGAMKDHIRYISKSDPTRFYNWVTDAAHLYLAINDDNAYEHAIEDASELDRALTCLTKKEQAIVTMYINEDLTFSDISKKIGLSESQVSRIYQKSVKKITSVLNPNSQK